MVGGHPCLDFVNTEIQVRGKRHDLLKRFAHWVAWLTQAQLLDEATAAAVLKWEGTAAAEEALIQARILRQNLRDMADHIIAGETIPSSVITELNHLLRLGQGYLQLVAGKEGGYQSRFMHVIDDPRQLLVPVAEAVVDLLCTLDLSLIKRCENPNCIRYFYDTTKNHSRRWCSMEACGNRMKVATYYRRRQQGR